MNEIPDWRPSASAANLLKRAEILSEIRRFFSDRGVFEVETPSMAQSTVTDPQISSFKMNFIDPFTAKSKDYYLVTSPEFHMKRLIAAGSGAIYQLCHGFRNDEMGRYHNSEFTLLEWYRPHYDMYLLINEVDDFLQQILECPAAETLSYQQAFLRHLNIDPLSATHTELQEAANKLDAKNIADEEEDRDTLLQLLFMLGVEPKIGKERPVFVYHFPATQASLATISLEDNRVADRFEVYFQGVELANGFHELTDSKEQRCRFEKDNQLRAARNLPEQPIDTNLLAALDHGLPACSGVALGVDRLVMLALKATSISEVMAFPRDRC